MNNTATKAQVKSAMAVMISVTETIREFREVPAGKIYAALMTKGCDFETYQKVERILIGSGLVEKRSDLLRWIGTEVRS